jgi:hypothetical protein
MLALALALAGERASAAEPPRSVVLVRPGRAAPVVREAALRAHAELEAAGFHVTIAESEASPPATAELEAAATAAGATAALAIFSTPGGPAAEVWIQRPTGHEAMLGRVDARGAPPGAAPSALAIRALELLRASLLELDAGHLAAAAPATPTPAPPRSPPTLPPAPAPLAGLTLGGGAAIVASPGGAPATLAPLVRVALGAASGLLARVTFAGPATEGKMTSSRGAVGVTQEVVALDAAYAPRVEGLPVVPIASVGAAGYHVTATRTPTPHEEVTDDSWLLAIDAGVGLGVELHEHLVLIGDVHAIVAEPRAVITVGQERLGSAGRPSIFTSGSLVARF